MHAQYPEAHYDAVRPGISIYGFVPGPGVSNPLCHELKPLLRLEARVTCVKSLPPGQGVSYGHTFHTTRDTRIAVLPLGYGDGIPRAQSNKLRVAVRGTLCPQVGRVTMDQLVVDVTDVPNPVWYVVGWGLSVGLPS